MDKYHQTTPQTELKSVVLGRESSKKIKTKQNENIKTKIIYVFQYIYLNRTWEDCHDFKEKKKALTYLKNMKKAYPKEKFRVIKKTITEEKII